MTKREMMVKAHGMAKQMVGSYSARLSRALRQLWASLKKGVVRMFNIPEMPILKGSEKQVLWANEIRKNWLNQIKEEVDRALYRVSDNTMPVIWGELVVDLAQTAVGTLSTNTDSKKIIDNRNLAAGRTVFNAAVKKYEELKNA